jgi:hypothetical protein
MHLDPRSVLLDPTGAAVGSVLFIACLIAIIVVSFFGVDVYKISVPFAVGKLLFDLSWDYYRFKHVKHPTKSATVLSDNLKENPVLSQLECQAGQQHTSLEPIEKESDGSHDATLGRRMYFFAV